MDLRIYVVFLLLALPAAAVLPQRFTRFSVEQGLSQSTVQAILQDRRGFIWFGTEEGLNRYDGYSFVVFKNDPTDAKSLPDNKVSTLHEDRQGRLWVGTWKGLSLFDYRAETFTAIPQIHKRVAGILEDTDDTLWGATEGEGLLVRGPADDTFHPYLHQPKDLNSLRYYNLSSVLRDHKGRLWIGSLDAGIDRVDEASRQFIHYQSDPRDERSLSSNEVWQLAEDGQGKIWIATYGGGLNTYDEKPVVFTSLRLFNEPAHLSAPLSTLNQVELSAKDKIFSIEFAALDYTFPRHNRYAYRLEGFSNQWIALDTKREVTFTNLDPGKYQFRVKACNNDGVWNQETAGLDIGIAPIWYQTIWFRSACAGAFALFLWALYQFRLRQLAREFNAGLEARVEERTRIARDLHDTLLQSFQAVLLKFHAVTYMIQDRPAEAQKTLETVIDQAGQAVSAGRDAVQGLRSSTVVSNDIARALTLLGEELAGNQTYGNCPEFHVNVGGTSRDLVPLLRDEAYRITSEALRNAFLHAEARRIEVEIHY